MADCINDSINISRLNPTGASAQTAAGDGLQPGVGASHHMAAHDLQRGKLGQYKGICQRVGSNRGVPAAVIGAIMSRETRAGGVIGANGRGADPTGYGLMQIDLDHSGIPRDQILQHGPFSEGHVDQAVSLKLVPDYYTMSRNNPNITNEKTFQGAVAAYNAGVGGASQGMPSNPDQRTTGRDYSNDVIARAQYLLGQGW